MSSLSGNLALLCGPRLKIAAVLSMLAINPVTYAQDFRDPLMMRAYSRNHTAVSDFKRYWPGSRRDYFKIDDHLILAIPPQYQQFWFQKDQVLREPADITKLPTLGVVGFSFFMPGFTDMLWEARCTKK